MTIAFESPDQADVIALIADLDAYQDALYPPGSRHALGEALALYASAGYERRGPYGDYTNDPLSVFMEKYIVA